MFFQKGDGIGIYGQSTLSKYFSKRRMALGVFDISRQLILFTFLGITGISILYGNKINKKILLGPFQFYYTYVFFQKYYI